MGPYDDSYPSSSSLPSSSHNPSSSSSLTSLRQHPVPRALAALLHALHDPQDSTALYALLLFHFQGRPSLLARLHALLERARSRHEPLAQTLLRAEERLLLMPPPPPPGTGEGVEAEDTPVAVAAALGGLRGLVEELRGLAGEKPASEVVLRYLEAAGKGVSDGGIMYMQCSLYCTGLEPTSTNTHTHTHTPRAAAGPARAVGARGGGGGGGGGVVHGAAGRLRGGHGRPPVRVPLTCSDVCACIS